MPLGPSASYLCKYNTYTLPGYVQQEGFDSTMNVVQHNAAYIDGSLSEETGLANKTLNVTLKVWEQNYLTCKQQIELAATMLRSSRKGFTPLYLQYTDRHYDALVKGIKVDKAVGTSPRILDYVVDFECKPWLVKDTSHTISGTTLLDTDDVLRTINDGGWTPPIITVTGTNVTVSGYTAAGDFTGYFSSTGAVTNLIVDTAAFTATMAGVNKNAIMNTVDYRVYVGPARTYFAVTGASAATLTWFDKWYI